MATITQTKSLVQLCRAANVSAFLWGAHGLGKSTLVRELADSMGIGFVDLRCAQLDSVDLRGFPDKGADGRTHFLPPADLPSSGDGILFLDELNRAGRDVLAALFQLVLDRRIGEYVLPAGWSVVAAGNFNRGGYSVTTLDPAFIDRFCHSIVSGGLSTTDEWSRWMMGRHGDIAYKAVNFCVLNAKHLEVATDDKLDFEIKPSRRSWDAVVRGVVAAQQHCFDEQTLEDFVAGLVGRELAISFMAHQPTFGPGDLYRVGMRALRPQLRKVSRQSISLFVSGVIASFASLPKDHTHQTTVVDLIDFLSVEHPDLAVALTTATLAHDPKFRELKNRAATGPLMSTISNERLLRRIQTMTDDLGFLSEILNRPRLRERLGELMGFGN